MRNFTLKAGKPSHCIYPGCVNLADTSCEMCYRPLCFAHTSVLTSPSVSLGDSDVCPESIRAECQETYRHIRSRVGQ